MTLGISNSEISMFKRCPRRWLVEYYYGFLPANPSPAGSRNIGIRWHTALEAKYGYDLDPGYVLDILYGLAIEENGDRETDLRKDHELSKIMMEGYLDWVAEEGVDAGLKVVEPEAEVQVPLPGWEGIVNLRAKLDQVVLDESTGFYSFLDHKTADNFERAELIELDPQMLTYSLIAWLATQGTVPQIGSAPAIREGVPLVNGGIVRTARRVKRTKTAKPPYFQNYLFRHSPERLAAHLLTTQKVVAEIMDARRQLDTGYANGGQPEQIQFLQLTAARPNFMQHDCARMCWLSNGLCAMMNDSVGWMRSLTESGNYVQGDAYSYYARGGIDEIKARLAAQ